MFAEDIWYWMIYHILITIYWSKYDEGLSPTYSLVWAFMIGIWTCSLCRVVAFDEWGCYFRANAFLVPTVGCSSWTRCWCSTFAWFRNRIIIVRRFVIITLLVWYQGIWKLRDFGPRLTTIIHALNYSSVYFTWSFHINVLTNDIVDLMTK